MFRFNLVCLLFIVSVPSGSREGPLRLRPLWWPVRAVQRAGLIFPERRHSPHYQSVGSELVAGVQGRRRRQPAVSRTGPRYRSVIWIFESASVSERWKDFRSFPAAVLNREEFPTAERSHETNYRRRQGAWKVWSVTNETADVLVRFTVKGNRKFTAKIK